MINITDWIAVIPAEDKCIAYVGEHEAVTRQFFLPDLTYRDYAFYLDMSFDLSTVTRVSPPRTMQTTQQTTTEKVDAEGTTVAATANTSKESYTRQEVTVDCETTTDVAPLAKLVREDGILLTWRVLGQQTRLPGLLRATLRAVGPDGDIKKSAMMLFTVSPSVEATPAVPIELSEHEQMEQAMVLALEQAAEDTYAAFEESLENAIGSVEQVRDYVDKKTAPATLGTTGTVKLGADAGVTGIAITEDGFLVVRAADKSHINGNLYGPNMVITVRNLGYAVKFVGDGYYALASDVGDVETALDSIIAIQESLIGGDGV